MNFWISGKPEELRETLARVDVLLINDAEARQLSGEWNMVKAARAIRAMGPRMLVVKKGEHGVLMFSEEGSFAAPAYPLEEVFDPTGAGDTFAGGFLGYLAAQTGGPDEATALRRAVIMGSTLASFCVEAFSLDRLLRLTAGRDRRALPALQASSRTSKSTLTPASRGRCVRIRGHGDARGS